MQRSKTDTPLQALALMNDPVQTEAARGLAERMLTEGGRTATERVAYAFASATARKLNDRQSQILSSLLERRLAAYREDPAAAKAFLSVGASQPKAGLDPVELAAYANVASLILNLDQVITRN